MNRTLIIVTCAAAGGILIGHALTRVEGPEDPSWPSSTQALAQPPAVSSPSLKGPVAQVPAGASPLTQEEQVSIGVYDAANRSVVNIDTKTVQIDQFFLVSREAEGSGSGAVIDRQGHVLTNYHVVEGAEQISVTLASGQQYAAEVIGHDKEQDIAVLKIDAPADQLFPITFGASNSLRVGQRVYALGNPFGWDGTLTTGIISSLNRNLPSRIEERQMQSLIQTDAAMNPGNSGGPLLDTGARMIGMCVAIATRTGQNAGVGFAIPIDRIRAILPDLIEHGGVIRADIGIVNVKETDSGLVIFIVKPDSPAAQAGLRGVRKVRQRRRQGPFVVETDAIDWNYADRIVAVDGQHVKTGVSFRDKIWERKPGDVVTLTIVRENQLIDVPVTLGSN